MLEDYRVLSKSAHGGEVNLIPKGANRLFNSRRRVCDWYLPATEESLYFIEKMLTVCPVSTIQISRGSDIMIVRRVNMRFEVSGMGFILNDAKPFEHPEQVTRYVADTFNIDY